MEFCQSEKVGTLKLYSLTMSHVIDWSVKSFYHFQKLLGNMKQTKDKKKAVTVNIFRIGCIFVVLYTYRELIMNVLISS